MYIVCGVLQPKTVSYATTITTSATNTPTTRQTHGSIQDTKRKADDVGSWHFIQLTITNQGSMHPTPRRHSSPRKTQRLTRSQTILLYRRGRTKMLTLHKCNTDALCRQPHTFVLRRVRLHAPVHAARSSLSLCPPSCLASHRSYITSMGQD